VPAAGRPQIDGHSGCSEFRLLLLSFSVEGQVEGKGGVSCRPNAIDTFCASDRRCGRTPGADAEHNTVTLENGSRVVIVRDPLAPVVTVDENYLVGDKTPAGFPGTAPMNGPPIANI
jgi:hypothetical protein